MSITCDETCQVLELPPDAPERIGSCVATLADWFRWDSADDIAEAVHAGLLGEYEPVRRWVPMSSGLIAEELGGEPATTGQRAEGFLSVLEGMLYR